jgi:hypothetical protein
MLMTSAAWGLRGTTAVHFKWYTGRIYVESWRTLTMEDKVKEQILAVRDTGLTNMFDACAVQCIASEMNFYELVIFLQEHKDDYTRFIHTGEL